MNVCQRKYLFLKWWGHWLITGAVTADRNSMSRHERKHCSKLNIHFPLCLRIHVFDNASNLGPFDRDNEAMAEGVSGDVGMVIWQMSGHQMM